MATYEFEKIGHKEFESLANMLCTKFISRGMNVFGDGPDGGREATYMGKMDYPAEADKWDGYLVVQCKQREKLGRSLGADTTWALTQLNKEMKMYEDAVEDREQPEYFIFITNVELSAIRNVGGKDKFLKRLEFWRKKLGIKVAHLWDRDKLNNLLDSSREIVQRFGQLQPSDLIHAATEYYLLQAEAYLAQNEYIETALSLFLQNELIEDQYVNIKQAGNEGDEQPPLARVFIDLRATAPENVGKQVSIYVADVVQRASDRSLAPTKRASVEQVNEHLANTDFSSTVDYIFDTKNEEPVASVLKLTDKDTLGIWRDPSRFVFIGGPGQGKSTLVQFLAQRHRASLLSTELFVNLDSDTQKAIGSIKEEADISGCGLPKHARLPFRIVLEQLANELHKGEIVSVMDYIAITISNRSGYNFTRSNAEHLLTKMPWLVIFDGLDEVPAVSNRKEVLAIITNFLTEARIKDADLLVIATTRPQGYSDEFDPRLYNHLTLAKLVKPEALLYAKKLIGAKYPSRPIKQDEVLDKLKVAVDEKATARLMVSPLQVTIMAVIVEIVERLPSERFTLFQLYYDIIYRREQGRARELAPILTRYQQGIKTLHDRIGLRLQISGESDAASESSRQSRISKAELEKIIRSYLEKDEHEGEELERITDAFMRIALDRLVFIMPLEADSYGFEVRSLQEFSAARALMLNGYTLVKERLRSIVPIPYWLNTSLFAIGSAFTRDDDYCDMIVQLCGLLNNDDSDDLLSKTLAGSRLALEILEESIGEERPIYRNQFLDYALRLLVLPHDDSGERLAALYEAKYEQRFKSAAQAAVGVDDDSLQLSLLIMLAKLSPELRWADEMLQKLWPKNIESERRIIEYIVGFIDWSGWKIEKLYNVIRKSPLYWAVEYSSDNTKIDWLDSLRELSREKDKVVKFKIEGKDIGDLSHPHGLLYSVAEYSEDILLKIAEFKPTHSSWQPIVLGIDFLLNRSAKNLADTLEAIAQSPYYMPGEAYTYDLPWQLLVILKRGESAEELLKIAERVRKGELGDTQDWLKAEARWEIDGCTPMDFGVFSDADWPFTAEIAVKGVQVFSSFTYSVAEDDSFLKVLLASFLAANSTQAREDLVQAIIFWAKHGYAGDISSLITIETLVEISSFVTYSTDVATVFRLINSEFDWISNVSALDAIGQGIDSLYTGNQPYTYDIDKVAIIFTSLLTSRPVKEGILCLLAGLAQLTSGRSDNQKLSLDFDKLSENGQLALISLNLFSLSSKLPVSFIVNQIVYFLDNGSELTQFKIRGMLSNLARRKNLSNDSLQVLIQLFEQRSLNSGIRESIIDGLITQVQYRNSGFGEYADKQRLLIPV